MDISVKPNKYISYYTQYFLSGQVHTAGTAGRLVVLNEINNMLDMISQQHNLATNINKRKSATTRRPRIVKCDIFLLTF